jgi:hypothetical protein
LPNLEKCEQRREGELLGLRPGVDRPVLELPAMSSEHLLQPLRCAELHRGLGVLLESRTDSAWYRSSMRAKLAAMILAFCWLTTCERDSRLAKAGANGHEAKIVKTTEVSTRSGGGEFGPSCSRAVEYKNVELRVDGFKRDITTEWTEGARVELGAAPDGHRFAYRVNGGPWRPVWRGKHDIVLGADSQRISGESVDWNAVPTFAVAAKDVFRLEKDERDRVAAELAGTPALAEVLSHSVDGDAEFDDGWSKAFRSLAADQQENLRGMLTARVLAGERDPNVLLRYAEDVGIRTEEERTAILATLSAVHTHAMRLNVKERLVAQAARVDLAGTAAWSCTELERYKPEKFFFPEFLYWVMAKASQACDAAEPQLRLIKGCSGSKAPSEPLERTIDRALGKLAGDPAAKETGYIENEEAISAFAMRTLSEDKRRELCQGAQAPPKE